jgi:hypothetical protein
MRYKILFLLITIFPALGMGQRKKSRNIYSIINLKQIKDLKLTYAEKLYCEKNSQNRPNTKLLWQGITENDLDIVQEALDNGADIEIMHSKPDIFEDGNYTALGWMIYNNCNKNLEIIKAILEKKPN